MANWTYLTNVDNKLVGATITPSSASTIYPIVNLTTLPISKPWRSTSTTADLQIDLGSASPINLAVLINTNLTNAATITLRAGSSANPNGSQFETTIVWRARDCFRLLSSPQTWRYWKVSISDSGNPNGFIELGFAMLGAAPLTTFQFRYGGQFIDEQVNLSVETEFGSPHVVELHERHRLVLPFTNLPTADAATLLTLYRTVKRNLIPLFLIPDSVINDGYFGRWVSQFDRTDDFYKSIDMEFVEDGRGDRIAA